MARPRDPNRPKRKPKEGATDGYCCPPKHGQIQLGEVRNRWGPKGKPKPPKPDAYEAAMAHQVSINIGGKTRLCNAEEAAWFRHAAAAVNGDRHAFKVMVEERRIRRPAQQPTEEDPAVIAEKKALSAKLIGLLDDEAARKKGNAEDR